MKTYTTLITSILLFISLHALGQATFKIKASVQSSGENFIAILIDDNVNFPGITKTSIQQKGTKTAKGAEFIYEDVPRGNYAILVFHDENNNGSLDMDGSMPSEAFGYSNYVMMGPPTWKNCSFQVDSDKEIEINLYQF